MKPTSPFKKRIWGTLATTVVAAFMLSACGGETTTEAEPGAEVDEDAIVEDGTLTFGLSTEPSNLLTGQDAGVVGYTMFTLLHRGLMEFDETGEVVEGLAESYEQPESTNYVFTLREGLEFSDGTPITAEVVEANLEFQSDPENSTFVYPGLQSIESIDTPDDRTVDITLNAPNAAFLQYLAVPTAAIVPEDVLDPTESAWVGAGPYVIDQHNHGTNMVLSPNESFYAADEVSLGTLDLVFYPDGTARTNALVSGEVDLIDYVPWEDFERIESDSDLILDPISAPFMYVHFNVEDEEGPMADPLIREAVGYAINRDNIVDAVFSGNGEPLYGMPLDENDPNFDEEWENMYDYDPDRARELLDEAGYDDSQTLTLLTSSEYVFHQDTALSVQADLEAVGINVELANPDWATRVSEGIAGNYDLAVAGNSAIVPDTSWISSYVGGPVNYSRSFGYDYPELTGAVESGLEAEEEDERREHYAQAREMMIEDTPIVMLSTRDQAYAYNQSVGNFENYPGFLTFYSGYSLTDAVEVQQ